MFVSCPGDGVLSPGNFANPSASVGLAAVNGSALTAMRSDAAPVLDQTIAPTWTAAHVWSKNGALSLPTISATGTWVTGGSATTTKPLVLIEPTNTPSTGWSTSGTALGINGDTAFAGQLIDAQKNGTSRFMVSNGGTVTMLGSLLAGLDVRAGASGAHYWTGRSELYSPANGQVQFSSSGVGSSLILTISASAVWQLGAANAASPVAQTLQAQGSRSGTDTNVGGANITMCSGTGTGTGTVSTLVLQSPVAVASGTGAQTQTTGLTVKVGTAVLTNYTVANLPAAATAGSGATAFVTDANTTLILGLGAAVVGGGGNKVPVYSDGTNWIIG